MKIINSNTGNRIITSLLLMLIGGIIFNSSFFLHTHVTDYGERVTHAHPFNKSTEKNNQDQKHEHNKLDLKLISLTDCYTFLHSDINLDCNYVFELNFLLEQELLSKINIYSSITLRGPPSRRILL